MKPRIERQTLKLRPHGVFLLPIGQSYADRNFTPRQIGMDFYAHGIFDRGTHYSIRSGSVVVDGETIQTIRLIERKHFNQPSEETREIQFVLSTLGDMEITAEVIETGEGQLELTESSTGPVASDATVAGGKAFWELAKKYAKMLWETLAGGDDPDGDGEDFKEFEFESMEALQDRMIEIIKPEDEEMFRGVVEYELPDYVGGPVGVEPKDDATWDFGGEEVEIVEAEQQAATTEEPPAQEAESDEAKTNQDGEAPQE